MNPSGLRIEEKKSADASIEERSQSTYKSTHSSRSSVLERAREYNRRIDEQNRRRTKSLERSTTGSDVSRESRRSLSVGRVPTGQSRAATRERAMASVRAEAKKTRTIPSHTSTENTHPLTPTTQYSTSESEHLPAPQSASAGHYRSTAAPVHRATQKPASRPAAPVVQNASPRSRQTRPEGDGHPVVTPELLVDALSGHEDGLLAIAERLMEHYDAGYDVMGEAIIDAFADVQKLFQHVVEAAHMEGAAFEASRREEEIAALRKQAEGAVELDDASLPSSPSGPNRHDEFIDQDVKDVLTEAIRKGSNLRDANKHAECFELYDQACQAASSLLPVDSDHRGRLQLSLARAESMTPDRACAILRYAMDDVLRSGMRAHRTPLPDPSKRADVVLTRTMAGQTGVTQSADEALASLIEEMKEILSAPVYADTPLQAVARRFWAALTDAQKGQQKNEERLEQQLGKLKGDYLLAKAVCCMKLISCCSGWFSHFIVLFLQEWEEKLNQANEKAEVMKDKYERLKETTRGEQYMDQARSFASKMTEDEHNDMSTMYGSVKSGRSNAAGSVASIGSGLAQQAKTLVNTMNNFNCGGMNERSTMEEDLNDLDTPYQDRSRRSSRTPASRSRSATRKGSRFREYSRSPQRVDV